MGPCSDRCRCFTIGWQKRRRRSTLRRWSRIAQSRSVVIRIIMNILYINHYAGSLQHGMEYRPFYLGREWQKADHRVRIVAASISHVRSRQPNVTSHTHKEKKNKNKNLFLKTPTYESSGVK